MIDILQPSVFNLKTSVEHIEYFNAEKKFLEKEKEDG